MKKHIKMIWIIVIGLVIVTVGSYWSIVNQRDAIRQRVSRVAMTQGKLVQINNFMIFQNKHIYYSVSGRNHAGELLYVITNRNYQVVKQLKATHGLAEEKVLAQARTHYHPAKILKITLGLWHNQPAWEVTMLTQQQRLTYVTYDFESGDTLQVIANL